MNIELKVAIGFTILFIITYFITGSIVAKYSIISLFPFNITNCILKMEIQDLTYKKCLCPDSANVQNCIPTGKTYVNKPSECKKCPPVKTPIIIKNNRSDFNNHINFNDSIVDKCGY